MNGGTRVSCYMRDAMDWSIYLSYNGVGDRCRRYGKGGDLFDLGGTSLSLIQLLKRVKDVYGISLDTSQFTEELTKTSFATAIINQKALQNNKITTNN